MPSMKYPRRFGNYVDIYNIAQAVEDGATVRIYYEAATSLKLSLIFAAKEHILGREDGRKRYINES